MILTSIFVQIRPGVILEAYIEVHKFK